MRFASRFFRVLGLPIAVTAGAFLLAASHARADEASDRLAALERRIAALETRLAASEVRARGAERALAAKTRKTKPAATQAPVATGPATTLPSAAPGQAPTAAAEKAATPEYTLIRENIATLSAHSVELSAGVGYDKSAALFQNDRAFAASLSARIGIVDGVEFGVNVPYYYSKRVTQIGPLGVSHGVVSSLGDVSAQITALAFRETADLPAVNVTVGAVLPTGASPYLFGVNYAVSRNPIDPFFGYQSRREWGAIGAVEFSKTVDPLVLFAGFGFEYTLPHTLLSHRLAWPVNWTYNFGLAFALTDKSTLGFSVNGAFQNNLRVDGVSAMGTATEPIVARVSLSEKIAQDTYIEPSVGVGLSKDAPNLAFGVALRKRY